MLSDTRPVVERHEHESGTSGSGSALETRGSSREIPVLSRIPACGQDLIDASADADIRPQTQSR